ncbi:hypothetical protein CEXT_346881 [Caerostris extrusa]|uniref:Uncharacterized protein n=1 Tax=Caerostris extrusa TaxID=172846 RepID=A0AAV4V9I7_CAEEX|nr:hypothetical protein CEXT_346881 [Caerostris extrusa]
MLCEDMEQITAVNVKKTINHLTRHHWRTIAIVGQACLQVDVKRRLAWILGVTYRIRFRFYVDMWRITAIADQIYCKVQYRRHPTTYLHVQYRRSFLTCYEQLQLLAKHIS